MPDRSPRRRTAIVIGGSAAGLFAAAVLADFANVTVIEQDTLPERPETRRGIPQDRHAHLVWSGGVHAFDDILPGIVDKAVSSGARLAHVMGDMVSRAPNERWFRRFTTTHHHVLVCSRPLLDTVLRDRVLSDPRITHHQNTKVSGLQGTPERITGVHLETAGTVSTLTADLIVDASGRGSRTPAWLQSLGLPQVATREVNAGVAYATRLYKTPGTTEAINFPLVNVQANPAKAPGQGGIILPIEDGRWIVTLSGTRGGEPTADPDAFVRFALGLGDPIIGELLADAEPLSDVATTRSTANQRRYYEKMRQWPDGYLVLGDAIASYNPVYGHGLTVAAQCALAVRSVLHSRDITRPGTSRRLQRVAARPVADAWGLAVGQDALYPEATDTPPTTAERLLARYVDHCVDTGARNPRALEALLDVMSMSKRPTRLFSPAMLFPLLFGPKRPRLAGAPLSEEERQAASG
ncbi:FAD-dependent monooxygenase [Streptomyces scabiei]|uniref:FAD-dependent monooxygenase n=1 Tax=Streptomyces scabiei TaxID=1930 RepID=UPI0033EBD2E0